MATLSQADKEDIGRELRVMATWVSGPRRVKMLELAERVEGTDPDEIEDKATEALHALDRPTEKPQLGFDAVPGQVVNDPDKTEVDDKK